MMPLEFDQLVYNRYKPIKWLGEGAMGRVLLAHDTKVKNRPVALKFINPEFLRKDKSAIKKFEVELERLTKFERHPNIVQVYDFPRLPDNTPFLVMSYIPGGSLQDRLDAGNWPSYVDRERLLNDLIKALSFTHAQNIIHRDLKPSNILIDTQDNRSWGTALISDFGVSILSGQSGGFSGGTGTPVYRAPEQRKGNIEITDKADQYALAVHAWQLFTHQDPPPQRDASLPEPIPDGLRNVLLKALSENPEDRFNSVTEFGVALFAAPAPPVQPPFKGLQAYEPEDDGLFFGRSTVLAEIKQGLEKSNFWSIVGPSGSGKSSLARAGLIPSYIDRGWNWSILSPGEDPLFNLAFSIKGNDSESQQLVDLMRSTPNAFAEHLVEEPKFLVVDQLEQLVGPTISAQDQRAFCDNLLHALSVRESNLKIVVTLRTDFIDQFGSTSLAGLRKQIATHQTLLGAMSEDEIREVIEKPTYQNHLYFSDGFVEKVISDVVDQPGALPLLSQALLETWKVRKGRELTIQDYKNLGGVQRAIQQMADKAYNELPSVTHQAIARRILLRLVQFNVGRQDTRRQQTEMELRTGQDASVVFEETLHLLSKERLITITTYESETFRRIDLAHEILITKWERLAQWIKDFREKEQYRRGLQSKLEEWIRLGRGNSGLLDDMQEKEARHWIIQPASADVGISHDLIEYIQTSEAAIKRGKEKERRQVNFQRVALATLSILLVCAVCILVIAGGLGLYANSQRVALATQVVIRSTAEENAIVNEQEAQMQARYAQADKLALQALDIQKQKPQLGLLLALESIKMTQQDQVTSPSALKALYAGLENANGYGLGGMVNQPFYLDQTGGIFGYSFNFDGSKLIVYGYKANASPSYFARIYDTASSLPLQNYLEISLSDKPANMKLTLSDTYPILMETENGLYLMGTEDSPANQPSVLMTKNDFNLYALSPDGSALAMVVADGSTYKIHLIILSNRKDESILPHSFKTVNSIAFSPNNRWLIIDDSSQGVILCNLSLKCQTVQKLYDPNNTEHTFIFSNDGHFLIYKDNPLSQVWDLSEDNAKLLDTPSLMGEIVSASISPDSTILGMINADGTVSLWQINDLSQPLYVFDGLISRIGDITSISISNDNQWLFLLGGGALHILDLTLPDPSKIIATAQGLINISYAVGPQNDWLAIGAPSGASSIGRLELLVYDLPYLRERIFLSETYGSDVDLLYGLTPDDEGIFLRRLKGTEGAANVDMVSSDGRWLITNSDWPDGTLRLWDMSNYTHHTDTLIHSGASWLEATNKINILSPDGQWLASKSDVTINLWNISMLTTGIANSYKLSLNNLPISYYTFSPQSDYLLVVFDNGMMASWQINQLADPDWIIETNSIDINYILFSSDQRFFITRSDSQILVWEFRGKLQPLYIQSVQTNNAKEEYLSPNGKWLWLSSNDTSYLWNLSNADQGSKPFVMENFPISKLLFSSDSTWVCILNAYDQNGILIDLETGNIFEFPEIMSDFAFTPDNSWLVAGKSFSDPMWGDAVLWNLDQIRQSNTIDQANGSIRLTSDTLGSQFANWMTMSSNGKWLATVQQQVVHIWDLTDITKDPAIILHGQSKGVEWAAFSNDGKWFVTGNREYLSPSLILWDLTVEPISPVFLRQDGSIPSSISFSPDSKWLIEYNSKTTNYLSLDLDQLKTWACQAAGRNLSISEWNTYLGNSPYKLTCSDLFSYLVAQ